ncbi:MAG: ferrous iron transport protein B [Prevotellaceae bacterium]|jgi:ferrous iron transport protein B|nr:ferrous iron transport protein B [Prevotellaceae bacterium]
MRLSDLKTGEKGVIVKVLGHGGFRKRIVEMGFIKGKTVEVLLNAPLKDPVKYKVMGYEVSLRRQEAELIEVVSEQEAKEHVNQYTHTADSQPNLYLKEDELQRMVAREALTINVALVGNPNCGKTSLFNIASGAHEHVGNYSGVTVNAKDGYFDMQGYHFRIVDLPGTYSLSAYSPEELYVRRHIVDKTPDVIINVLDSTNLERNLYLTTQLIDMNVRMVAALNMYDELESSGNVLDYVTLGKLLGVPMVPTVGRTGKGIEELFATVIDLYEEGDMQHSVYRHIHINHGPELERSIDEVKQEISHNENIRHKYSTRFLAIKLMENDPEIEKFVATLPNGPAIIETRDNERRRIRTVQNEESEQAIIDAKYGFIAGALKETFVDNHQDTQYTTRVIDAIVTNRVWGFPIFFLLMWLMFEGTFVLGEYPMEGIDWLVGVLGDFIRSNMSEGPLKDMLVDGIIGGVGGVIVFLPNILILYFCISFMEDSGYMARAAFIMDKVMHKMGLHGKSFIPLVMGFGCNVPAVMASRTIENRKSRLITMLINPLMSCSARLPIYLLLIGAFFPEHGGLVLLSIYLIGILLSVVLARLFSRFLVKGDDTPFVMELPPYRLPTLKAITRHTWEKGSQYLRKMGGIIMVASMVIWALGYYPNHDAYPDSTEQQEHSYIGQIGKAIVPIIEPLGFDWKLGVGLISGLGAKELVVSTMGVLYANDADADTTTLAQRIPITPLTAYGYMVFVLLYFPCFATFAAIKNESGSWKWAVFTAVYTTALAWIAAYLVHLIGGMFI